jgi:Tfp pilus assembly protein PilV
VSSHRRGLRWGSRPLRQRGVAVFFALIMMVLLTLLAVSAFNTKSVNLQIVANVQARQEAAAAADQAAQQVASSSAFAFSSTQPYTTAIDVDVNKDGTADYGASVTASCITYQSYPAAGQILDPLDPCAGSASIGAFPFCTQTQWDVQSRVVPAPGGAYPGNAGADVTVHQGLSVVMSQDNARRACP